MQSRPGHRAQARRNGLGGTILVVIVTGWLASGCFTHQIAFDPAGSWKYAVEGQRLNDAGLVAVIDPETAESTYAFRAFTTGLAHKWVANYGRMLVQVADVELPQLVGSYETSSSYREPTTGTHRLTVVLTVPEYVFADFRAKMKVHAEGFGHGRTPVFSATYVAEGISQAGKMQAAGAFGQKSAVRQSTLDALRSVFAELRGDISSALQGPETVVLVSPP